MSIPAQTTAGETLHQLYTVDMKIYSANDVVQIVGGINDAYLVVVTAVTTGGGSTATANSVLTNGAVSGFTITNPGGGYTTPPTVSIASTF